MKGSQRKAEKNGAGRGPRGVNVPIPQSESKLFPQASGQLVPKDWGDGGTHFIPVTPCFHCSLDFPLSPFSCPFSLLPCDPMLIPLHPSHVPARAVSLPWCHGDIPTCAKPCTGCATCALFLHEPPKEETESCALLSHSLT